MNQSTKSPASGPELWPAPIATPGRRIYALGGVRKLAEAANLPELVGSIDVATAHDRDALEMDAARRRARTTKAPPVHDKDQAVDSTLVSSPVCYHTMRNPRMSPRPAP